MLNNPHHLRVATPHLLMVATMVPRPLNLATMEPRLLSLESHPLILVCLKPQTI